MEASVGIHTGTVAWVGLSVNRWRGAAIGDAVSVAWRLAVATKELGVPARISEATARRLGDLSGLKPVAEIAAKCYLEPIEVSTLAVSRGGAPQ